MQSSAVRADVTVEFIDVILGTCIDSISINDFQNRSEENGAYLHYMQLISRQDSKT